MVSRRRENTFKQRLVREMGTRWHVQSHEDKYSTGIPDLSYGMEGVNGWIELKHLDKWPVHETTPVRFKRFTPEQANWLMKRGKKGGRCYLFIQVGDEFLIFESKYARIIKTGLTQNQLLEYACGYWQKTISIAELCEILTGELYAY